MIKSISSTTAFFFVMVRLNLYVATCCNSCISSTITAGWEAESG